jgi:two-component system, cell cycle response regulator
MKILIAEDSQVARTLLEQALRGWGYDVVLASDGEEAWRVLQRDDAPSIALLDWMMPGMDGLEICQRVRAAAREPYLYIVLLTGKDQQQDILRGLAAGADDYLCKPFDPAELEARLKTGRRMVELQAELIAARDALREQATTDALTGVANRRTILETLGTEVERCHHLGASCAVVFIDLDDFKRVNDTHGHLAGDTVLRSSAATLRSMLRPYDLLGRYGGEEFVVLLPGCDEEGARAAAERLRSAIASAAVVLGEVTVRITCSLGVALGAPGARWDRDSLLATADAAMYQAKDRGRDQVVVASSLAAKTPRSAPAQRRPSAKTARRRSDKN